MAKACELFSPQTLLPLNRVSLQRLAILDSLLKKGIGEGSLAPCPRWTGAWDQTLHFSGPAMRNMDHGKPTDTYQQEALATFLREQIYNLSVCGSIQFIKLPLPSDKHSSSTLNASKFTKKQKKQTKKKETNCPPNKSHLKQSQTLVFISS